MMIESLLAQSLSEAVKNLYAQTMEPDQFQIQKTRPEFEGELTVVVFPLLKMSRKSPEKTAEELGNFLVNNRQELSNFNVVKGFLNLTIADNYWLSFFRQEHQNNRFGLKEIQEGAAPVVIEYSSPNTNKPLHLGHIRNNLLGWSTAEILKANGLPVAKVNLVNDRGIHICKSMLAWQKWGKSVTPDSLGQKGDKLVGDFYVLFDKEYKKEIDQLTQQGMDKDDAARQAPLMLEAQTMLKKWEAGDDDVRKLWSEMNQWVYDGFDATYERMGVDFDKMYYESETYLLGKELVQEGLEKGIFYKKENGSVWCDLTDEGLDEKLLLRADGTSVYMTQDLGTAHLRYDDYHPQELIYVVGNEQNYHFDVLKRILKKLGFDWAEKIYHLSYGMVELPHGKMKSREGTVVDADELMEEMAQTARKTSEELGKFDDFSAEESAELYNMIGLGALKYFILKVDPKKNMMFNPEESIDFNGNTGPFIQYTHARIRSVLRKAEENEIHFTENDPKIDSLEKKEKSLLQLLHEFPQVVELAGSQMSPAQIANYSFDLAKEYNQFYHDLQILKEPDVSKRNFRLQLSDFTARTLRSSMHLLGITLPERM
ncbi:MAG: arginine--tRNA ligase [Bacteroidales bacterium]|nr:arginine--tRNA ligase [Bacteroidales bacterium]